MNITLYELNECLLHTFQKVRIKDYLRVTDSWRINSKFKKLKIKHIMCQFY